MAVLLDRPSLRVLRAALARSDLRPRLRVHRRVRHVDGPCDPWRSVRAQRPCRPPRARGGHPWTSPGSPTPRRSAPRTRGSSRAVRVASPGRTVRPPHAGVIPARGRGVEGQRSPPRARGGHPGTVTATASIDESAPRTRGHPDARIPIPALISSAPRTRGHPWAKGFHSLRLRSAQRTRGSSPFTVPALAVRAVRPAHAGSSRG